MNETLVTVIVPIYNVEKYLRRCIESIIKQTYTNIEIILIDDGSIDKSLNICEEYEKKDERIILIHQENEGVSSARNKGLDIAKGEYITFIDSDDYVDEMYVEQLYNNCIINKSYISVIGTVDLNEDGKLINKSKKIKRTYNTKKAIQQLLLEKYFYCVIWGKMYKKELFKEIRFNRETKIGEDLEVLNKIMFNCKRITINTKEMLYYSVRRKSGTVNQEYGKNFNSGIRICKEMIEKTSTQYPELKKYAIRRYIKINAINIIRVLKSNNMNDKQKEIEIKELKGNIEEYKKLKYFQDYKFKIKIFLIYKFPNLLKKIINLKTRSGK